MGFAVADAARERGWEVDLISGPVTLDLKSGVRQTFVETADEMLTACLDIFCIMRLHDNGSRRLRPQTGSRC